LKKNFLLTLSCFFVSAGLFAQDQPQKITYHGQFRTLVGDYNLSGDILDANPERTTYKYLDTTSARRGSQGTMVFDLGINCKPNESFKFLAEMRVRNAIGLDAAQAVGGIQVTGNTVVDSRMLFRQIRIEGDIKKAVQYQIGDIDLGLTKYTLYGNDETFHTYESEIYRQRRIISKYETFQNGNLWRLQGATAKARIDINKGLERIDITMFGTRSKRNNNEISVLDRFLVGGKLDITQSKYLNLGVNWLNFFDVPGSSGQVFTTTTIYLYNGVPTGQTVITNGINVDTAYNYNNQVLSLNYKISPVNNDNAELSIIGESGISSNKYYIRPTTLKKNDFFIDAGLRFLQKPKKIELTASYINVGPNFTSPGAQTLRLNTFGRTNLLGSVFNNNYYRVPTIFERYGSEFIYNQRIQTGLMGFLPLYGNVLPYGAATPNRSGLIFNFGRLKEADQIFSASAGGAMLSEIVSEGDSIGKKLRKFLQLQGGAALKISKLIGYKRNITVSAGGRYENTTRTGGAPIDYKSTLIDAGLTFEITKGLSLIGGVKYLHGKGTEVITNRDVFGRINGFSPYTSDITQRILSGGIKIDMFDNSFASIEYNKIIAKNNQNIGTNYALGNLFFNFTLRF
jgi:hypothetical protein